MKVIDGIQKVQKYFPGVVLFRYLNPEQNDRIAQRMHMLGEMMVNDRNDLIKAMDSLSLGIFKGQYIKLHG